MFFILSKVLGLLLNPLVWLFGMLAYGILSKNKRRARIFLWVSLFTGLLVSNSFVASELSRRWEIPLQAAPDSLQPYDIGIVLGGGIVQSDLSMNRLIFRNNTDRIFQAIQLYKEKRIRKILISSGSGNLIHRWWPEASLTRDYLLKIGIPETDILVDSLSRNTHENAINSAAIIAKQAPKARLLLITSSVHMRRAMGCFSKAGLMCTPYPTNPVAGPRHYDLSHILMPQATSLQTIDVLMHEILGYATYRIAGYI